MVRKACFFLLFFTGVFSYAVGNRSLVVKTPRALSSHDYPQEGIVSFLLEEGIYVRLAVMPGWHVIRGNISNASRLSLETTMEFEGPIRSPDVRLAFVLRNEKNKPIYTTNILSDTKYGLVDVINEVSAEVAKALGVDISERGILVVRVIPYFAVGGKIKIQGNVLGHITNDQGFEDRYELVANEEYEILLEDKKEKGLLSNKVMVAKGGEKSLLLTPFNDRVMMSYGFASFSPLKQEEKQSGGAGFVDVSYFLFPRKWSFDYMMGIASVETPLIELFLGTGWYQTLLKERLYVRARFLTGIGVMGGETSWNTMVMGGVMIKWNHLVIGGDIGVGYNMPSYFLSDHWYDRFHGWIGFYF